MTPASVMIFAAGFGTRMGTLTANRPKALLPIGDATLLDRTIQLTRDADIAHHVVNAHYLADQVREHLAGTDVVVSVELPDILDTGGGLKRALPLLKAGTVFTSNSDAIWSGPNPFQILRDAWSDRDMDALLLLVPLERAHGRRGGGDFDLVDGKLIRRGNFVYTGVQILKTDAVAAHPKEVFSLNEVWDRMGETGRLCGAVYPGHWCDVGHPEGISLAESLLEENPGV